MKITNEKLKQLIKEELDNVMMEMEGAMDYRNMDLLELEKEFEQAIDTDFQEAKRIAAEALKIDRNIGEVWGGYIETLIEKGQYNYSPRRFFDDILNNMARNNLRPRK